MRRRARNRETNDIKRAGPHSPPGASLLIFWFLAVLAPPPLLLSSTADAGDGARQKQQHQPRHRTDAAPLSRSKLHRWRRRWRRSNENYFLDRSVSRSHSRRASDGGGAGSGGRRGSVVSLRLRAPPNPEDLTRWFWEGDSCGGGHPDFNHATAGMTNPCLRIDPVPATRAQANPPQWRAATSASSLSTATAMTTSTTGSGEATIGASSPGGSGSRKIGLFPLRMAMLRRTNSMKCSNDGVVSERRATTGAYAANSPEQVGIDSPSAERAWWPAPAVFPLPSCGDFDDDDAVESGSRGDGDRDGGWQEGTSCWHTIRMRQRVGSGWSCYQRVRDAALNWEFSSRDGRFGISPVDAPTAPAARSRNPESVEQQKYDRRQSWNRAAGGRSYSIIPMAEAGEVEDAAARTASAFKRPSSNSNAMQIWCGPGGRRLATWTRALPFLNVANPVGVLYDAVDQHASAAAAAASTTPSCCADLYTSTAYATMRGHWLCGEERVTVAYRPSSSTRGNGGHVDVEILSLSRPGNGKFMRWVVWPLVTRKAGLQRRFFKEQMRYFQDVAASPSLSDDHQNDPAAAAASDGNSRRNRKKRVGENINHRGLDELYDLSLISLHGKKQ